LQEGRSTGTGLGTPDEQFMDSFKQRSGKDIKKEHVSPFVLLCISLLYSSNYLSKQLLFLLL